MPARPLLILPRPNQVAPPRGGGGGNDLRLPPRDRQTGKFGPVFSRLRGVLDRANSLELRSDPTSLAPDRVIVFEIAGTVANFFEAASRVPGLEFMTEFETEFEADDSFAVRDTRRGREGQDRADRSVGGRFYMAMPDARALSELVRLWERWEANQPLDRGYAPFRHLFNQLRTVRPLYELDSQGRMKTESKESARARGVSSPDRAEALMLALCKPPQKYEYYSLRDLPRLGSQNGHPLPDDDDDDFPSGSSRSRDWSSWAPGSLARSFRRHPGTW